MDMVKLAHDIVGIPQSRCTQESEILRNNILRAEINSLLKQIRIQEPTCISDMELIVKILEERRDNNNEVVEQLDVMQREVL